MKTLSAPLTAETAASASRWTELFDIYLSSPILTPWGTVSVLRLTNLPGGLTHFAPSISPEPAATQGAATAYVYWPIKRAGFTSDSKSVEAKLQISASNVSTEWAAMLALISWRDTPIIIRKIATSITAPEAADDAILWSGAIDAAQISETQVSFECSSDLANLSTTAPRENMHTNCRFAWGDDLCTAIQHLPANYKAGTAAANSTTVLLKSTDLTEDTSAADSYGTDLIAALADAAITSSSDGGGASAEPCSIHWADINGTRYLMVVPDDPAALPHEGDRIVFSADTAPGNITIGKTYRASYLSAELRARFPQLNGAFRLWDASASEFVEYSSAGVGVEFTGGGNTATTDFQVKASNTAGFWCISNTSDWGTVSQGFVSIPDAQAGLTNMALKPYIQFDLGSAVAPKTWRISSVPGVSTEGLVKLLMLGHSADASTWTFLSYFMLPPVGGVLYDCLVPFAPAARYWRICVRSRWGASYQNTMLAKVSAYASSRNYWLDGRVTFAADTTTALLRGVSARILSSFAGQCSVTRLPAAPAAGDTFTIQRGCARTFNACAARRNTENFGGFTDLPFQTIIR